MTGHCLRGELDLCLIGAMKTYSLFPTVIAHESLNGPGRNLLSDLRKECLTFAKIDEVGQAWSKEKHYQGYTSYNSIPQIYLHSTTFEDLEKCIHKSVNKFAKKLGLDPRANPLEIDTMWINVMEQNAFHTSHTHPLSVVSGTFYVSVSKNSSSIRFEDPRFPLMMAQPLKVKGESLKYQSGHFSSPYHFDIRPAANDLVLFESFLRHEVPLNHAKQKRISISFNYRLK